MKILIGFCVFLLLAGCGHKSEPSSDSNSRVGEEDTQTLGSNGASAEATKTSGEQDVILGQPQDDSFREVSIPWSHNFDKSNAHPVLGSTLGDFDADGVQEVFVSGGYNQEDIIIDMQDDIPTITNIGGNSKEASYGAYSLDYDSDGDIDIIVGREGGVYAYVNSDGGFSEKVIWDKLPNNAVPLDIDFGDIDNDGDADIFISTFINPSRFKLVTFNDPNHVQENILLENTGDGQYENVYEKWGLTQKMNTFTSSFADLDGDGKIDLVMAPNTAKLQVFRNTGNSFQNIYTSENGFWMGLAIVDINHDGLLDIFSSNTGTSIPQNVLRGDLESGQSLTPDYAFLIQKPDGSFTNEYNTLQTDGVGFGWGITPLDIHGDGNMEISIAQNNIKWPPHKLSKLPGSVLSYQNSTLQSIEKDINIENKNYGISTLYGDVNDDLLQDIVFVNLDGSPRILLQDSDENERVISLDTQGNPKYLHANITYTFENGDTYTRQYIPKQGLLSKQGNAIVFRYNFIDSFGDTITLDLQNDEQIIIQPEKKLHQTIVLE